MALETQEQNTNLWLSERKKRITGSTCYQLYTYTSNKNPDWDKKIKRLLTNNFTGNANTSYGLIHEMVARKRFSEAFSLKIIEGGLIVHQDYPFLGYSPDGLIIKADERQLLEIKCPVEGLTKSATELVQHLDYLEIDSDSKYVLKKKHKFYGQIQLGLFLLNMNICELIIYSSYDNSFF